MPATSVLTLGYDPEKGKFVGARIVSFRSLLGMYEGAVDATGNVLTLVTEGPSPTAPGKLCKWREVTELKSKDRQVFTLSVQGEDGKWNTMVIIDSRRKK